MNDSHTDKLSYALDYAKRGWPVLPLQFITDKGRCSCGAAKNDCGPGKHPLVTLAFKRGYQDATVDTELIKKTWSEHPYANIGWTLGKVIALDQDNRHGGEKSLAALEAKYGPLPPTVTALTGSGDGSRHRYYLPPNSGVNLMNVNKLAGLPGLELKVNGYVVAVGSITTQPYVWQPGAGPDDIPFAPIPDWLVELSLDKFKLDQTADGTKADKPQKGYRPLTAKENEKALAKVLESCAFLQHCATDAKTLPEPEWRAMIEMLVFFGAPGEAKIHELSQPYPTYSEEATNKKINNAVEAIGEKQLGPYTCAKIQQSSGFNCPSDCLAVELNTHSPVTMAMKAVTAREEPPLEEIFPDPHVYSKTLVYRYNVSGQSLSESQSDKKATERATSLSALVKTWVEGTAGWWATDELDKDLGITAPLDRKNRSKTLERLLEQGMVERHQKINKQWRFVNKKATRLDYKHALSGGELDIKWPMNIEKYVRVYPGNLVVIAGATNSGKTGFNLDFIYRNQDKYPIVYICSEMGDVELKSRLELFPNMAIDDWSFEAVTRATDFADVIVPDVINIVDYLELAEDLYLVNSHLTKMVERIGSGLILVSLQKKEGARWGRGQEFSAEKSKLYLSMDEGILRITKGKSWANPKVNPNGLQVGFKIIAGSQFVITQDWHWKH